MTDAGRAVLGIFTDGDLRRLIEKGLDLRALTAREVMHPRPRVVRDDDCHFKKNQYSDALTFYNEAVKQKYDGYEYALYQKAMIKGLQGSGVDKVVALEDFVEKFPDSRSPIRPTSSCARS